MTFAEKRAKYVAELKKKYIYAEGKETEGISFSLSQLGLQGVFAEISKEEIQYHVENDEEEVKE